jgi:hypothetical protein
MLPPDGRLPTDPHPDGSVTTEVPVLPHQPGPGSGASPAHRRATRTGFGRPGHGRCIWRYRVRTQRAQILDARLLAAARSSLRRRRVDVHRAGEATDRLPQRAGPPAAAPQTPPRAGLPGPRGTPITAGRTGRIGGVAQGAGPVRPFVGNQRGVTRPNKRHDPQWLAGRQDIVVQRSSLSGPLPGAGASPRRHRAGQATRDPRTTPPSSGRRPNSR